MKEKLFWLAFVPLLCLGGYFWKTRQPLTTESFINKEVVVEGFYDVRRGPTMYVLGETSDDKEKQKLIFALDLKDFFAQGVELSYKKKLKITGYLSYRALPYDSILEEITITHINDKALANAISGEVESVKSIREYSHRNYMKP